MKDRTESVTIWLTRDEAELLKRKMAEAGIQNRSAYVRKMVIDGYVVKLDIGDIRELISMLRKVSNDIDSIAETADTTGSLIREDIVQLKGKLDEIWRTLKKILTRLALIR